MGDMTAIDQLKWQLEAFVGDEKYRPSLRRPFVKDGFVYATNGRIGVRIEMTQEEKSGFAAGDESFQNDPAEVKRVTDSLEGLMAGSGRRIGLEWFSAKLANDFASKRNEVLEKLDSAPSCFSNVRCPCCGARLYWDDEHDELLDADEYCVEKQEDAVRKIVARADLDGTLFKAEDLYSLLLLTARRGTPFTEAWLRDDKLLVLKGNGIQAVVARVWLVHNSDAVVIAEIHCGETEENKGEQR